MIAFLIAEEPSMGWSIYLRAVAFGLIGFALWTTALFASLGDDDDEEPVTENDDHECIDWNSGGACFICRRPIPADQQLACVRRQALKAAALGKKAPR